MTLVRKRQKMAKPILPDGDTIRAELEEFIQLYEKLSEEIAGTKGYIRTLMQNDDYAFNCWVAAKFLETARPKSKYYYEMFHDRDFTQKELDLCLSLEDLYWTNNVPLKLATYYTGAT